MLALSILIVFILIVAAIILIEIRNEKKYQAARRGTVQKPQNKTETQSPKQTPKKAKPKVKEEEEPKKKESETPTQTTVKPTKKSKKLPTCTYPKFSHARLVEMGLTEEESVEFVQELIPQLELQIPLIEEVMNIPDFHQMERLTHSIKGSATNIGTGGISDLLVEANTYLKTGTDIDMAKTYFKALKHYTQELKEQYA